MRALLFTCELPNPPSVNNLFFNAKGKGRMPTARYKYWKQEAHVRYLQTREGETGLKGKMAIMMIVGTASRADLDNHAKAVLDFLVSVGVLPDDGKKHVKQITLEWGAACDDTSVYVFRYEED